MKNKLIISSFVLAMLFSANSYAQFNPHSNGVSMITAGVGFSSWGIPIFARYEAPVADNITVGGGLSFQTKSDTYGSSKWKTTLFSINARGSYHFNELLEVTDEWDFYAGVNLGYVVANGKWTDNGGNGNVITPDSNARIASTSATTAYGFGSGGIGVGIHLGARYFIKDNLGINLEVGGGSQLSGGTIGVTFLL